MEGPRRESWGSVLTSARGREKLIAEIDYACECSTEGVSEVPKDWSQDQLVQELTRLGAPADCRVYSRDPDMCGLELPLTKAVKITFGGCQNSMVSCVPGTLAYFESEEKGRRYIMQR